MSTKKMTPAEMEAKLALLQAENDKLKKGDAVTCKIGEKGGLSIYGLGGRFPMSLYVEQFDKLVANFDDIKSFVDQNRSKLKTRDQKQ